LARAGISRGLFAPALSYNAKTDTWYLINTNVDNGGNFFVTAKNPAGPWSEPTWMHFDGIDPSFFFDDNGKAYVINNGPPAETPRYNGHRAIWIQEFDVASGTLVGSRSLIVNGGVDLSKNPIWIEAPHIFKRNGFYYLICAEGGTADQHSEVVFRGNNPLGPWTPFAGNPILTQRHLGENRPFPVTSTGHADFVETPTGETWAVFLGTRPYAQDTYNIGRETFLLPVKWENDWPVILKGNELVPYVVKAPTMAGTSRTDGFSGNFTIRDEFNGTKLPFDWQTIRGPAGEWLDLTSSPGSLTLVARNAGLEPAVQPSWVGRRQQHVNATVTTALRYVPARIGDKAGVMAFQNDAFYWFLAVARTDSGVVVQVERQGNRRGASAPTGVIAARVIQHAPDAPLFLRIDVRGGLIDFSYATEANRWMPLLANGDATILSTKVAQGFVGTMFGLYAYSPTGPK
jgi:xylan 1,4-beta-xylosidase